MEKFAKTLSSKIRNTVLFIFEWIKKELDMYYDIYGLIGLIAVGLVLGKIFLFYSFMNITTNLFFVWATTCILLWVLFSSFRNKWIPLLTFTLITILMFADVTYSSFFNRYLSIGMIGAAGVLGDIGESIKEVIKPKFFLLFIDLILIYATLIFNKIPIKKKTI